VARQDAQGRRISDDGLFYWDGVAWRPLGAQPSGVPPTYGVPGTQKRPAWPLILIGCGFAAVVVIVIGIALTVFAVGNADFQRAFCNGWTNSNTNMACPFSPPSATP
jgi:hypothetical protein